MSSGASGLVIGKFFPPHAGHSFVIDDAISKCRNVDVIVCDLPGQIPKASTRVEWLRQIHPTASVFVVPDICGWHQSSPCPKLCSQRWVEHLESLGLGPWDFVFGSDTYLEEFSQTLGAQAVVVDKNRVRHPISGTKVRANLSAHWSELHPVVRAGMVRRVVVLGAESTGSTTLASDLAEELKVRWVPEYGREFSANRVAEAGSIWDVTWRSSDFDHIAERQEQLEDETIRSWVNDVDQSRPGKFGPMLVCDTDTLATAIWHRRYCGEDSPKLLEKANGHSPLLYVLTSPSDVPFRQDGLRDGEHLREAMTTWFRAVLNEIEAPWIEVQGNREERKQSVVRELENRLSIEFAM